MAKKENKASVPFFLQSRRGVIFFLKAHILEITPGGVQGFIFSISHLGVPVPVFLLSCLWAGAFFSFEFTPGALLGFVIHASGWGS